MIYKSKLEEKFKNFLADLKNDKKAEEVEQKPEEENPEEENKSFQHNQTTSRIQSIGLNGLMRYLIQVGLMIESLLK